MRSTTNVAWLAGPLVVLGYAVGSVPVGYLLARAGLRRDMRRRRPGDLADVADDGSVDASVRGRPGELIAGLLSAALALGTATATWHVVRGVAPPATSSSIAILSSQAITVWQSMALWAGLAVLVGQVAPMLGWRRGGSGIGAAVVLGLAYAPVVFGVSVAGFFAVLIVDRRFDRAGFGAYPAAVTFAWLAWVYDLRPGWGAAHGPELALWTTAVVSVLYVAHRARVIGVATPRSG